MALDKAGIGYGASVAFGDGADPEVFTKIGKIVDINGRETSQGEVDTTNQDSPGRTKESIPDMLEPGEAQFDCILIENETTHATLKAKQKSGVIDNWRVLKPAGYGFICKGYPTNVGEVIPLGDKMTLSVTIKFTGEATDVVP